MSITLLMLMPMAVRFNRRAKAEAALPLLRELGIHMLPNRPLNQGVLERFDQNMVWWVDRTAQELTQIGASEYYISRLKALSTLEVIVDGDTQAHAHAKSVAATHLRKLEEAITALRIQGRRVRLRNPGWQIRFGIVVRPRLVLHTSRQVLSVPKPAYATWQVTWSDVPGRYGTLLYAPGLKTCALTTEEKYWWRVRDSTLRALATPMI